MFEHLTDWVHLVALRVERGHRFKVVRCYGDECCFVYKFFNRIFFPFFFFLYEF